jgi:serine/threonine protein phosphatase 1
LAWNVLKPRPKKAAPRVPDDIRVYAIGDVHGRADLLAALFDRIDADLHANPIGRPVQVLLGDYIDRGPQSRQVLDLLVARRRQHDMLYLKGNHETFAAQFLSDPSALLSWKRVGGLTTLLSYDVPPPTRDGIESNERTAAAFRQALPESHSQLIKSLALTFVCGDFLFVHAGVRPGIPLAEQRQEDLLWIREEFLLHEEDFGKIVVHGHTPVLEADVRPNRINIDTGAYATGRLTCLVLEGDRMTFI